MVLSPDTLTFVMHSFSVHSILRAHSAYYRTVMWLSSLCCCRGAGQKQKEPSTFADSETAGYGEWCSSASPRGAVVTPVEI